MKETIQLGLIGFGKETPKQIATMQKSRAEAERKAREREARIRIIPKGTVVYLRNQPEIAYTVVEPLYILRQKNVPKGQSIETVLVESETATVYRDGQRFEWGSGTIIQVHKKKMITKK